MAKIIAWFVVLVVVVVLTKTVLGVLAAFIPLIGGMIVGVPLGWVARSVKDGDDQ